MPAFPSNPAVALPTMQERIGGPNTWREDHATTAEYEVAALKDALRVTRHNPWLGDEVVDPEFENFLEVILRQPRLEAPERVAMSRSNPWEDFYKAAR